MTMVIINDCMVVILKLMTMVVIRSSFYQSFCSNDDHGHFANDDYGHHPLNDDHGHYGKMTMKKTKTTMK